MNKLYIGIDNGVTWSIGIVDPMGYSNFHKTPVNLQQDYTKTKKNVSRINVKDFTNIIKIEMGGRTHAKAIIERPMVNPGRFTATLSAVRCLEATLVILESLNIPYEFVDSKQWQKMLLPAGCKKEQLKTASLDIASRLFPEHKDKFKKQKDGDGMLIAEFARRSQL